LQIAASKIILMTRLNVIRGVCPVWRSKMEKEEIKQLLITEIHKSPRERDALIDCFKPLSPGVFLVEKCKVKGRTLMPEVQDENAKQTYKLGRGNRLVVVKWH